MNKTNKFIIKFFGCSFLLTALCSIVLADTNHYNFRNSYIRQDFIDTQKTPTQKQLNKNPYKHPPLQISQPPIQQKTQPEQPPHPPRIIRNPYFIYQSSPEQKPLDITIKETPSKNRECAFIIKTTKGNKTKKLCLVENVDIKTYEALKTQSINENLNEKLGITHTFGSDDFWAGAMNYCQKKGLRLPTMNELFVITKVLYNYPEPCKTQCNVANSQYVGVQKGCCGYIQHLEVDNIKLWNFLNSGKVSTWNIKSNDRFSLWSNAEESIDTAQTRTFYTTATTTVGYGRSSETQRALCVKEIIE